LLSGAQRGRVGKTGRGFRLPRRREQAEAELVQIRISILRDDYTTCLKIKKLNKQNAGMPCAPQGDTKSTDMLISRIIFARDDFPLFAGCDIYRSAHNQRCLADADPR
jgi:hypothetical protein